ncbi:receptor-like cytosolic serine/threonine-protein kinase RBK2 [Cucurbita pepo subsp. pepo]|uniref:receptor-like cytosolic serine/threonine-protein kinase RBK2 n=1 Tax=Cucurbita pepo subsp. pepo TaxID=3664 RepID=UPI000C9D64AC|nr:receptor-like cytosolic serine/threonine-protein kinase RBK2 [Cucurbita pepo subsp. pepo]
MENDQESPASSFSKTPERTLQRLKMLLQVSTAKKLDQQDSANMVECNLTVLQTGSNDSGDITCQDQSKDQTDQAVGTPKLGNRRPRGFSDSFASHELRLLELEDEAKDESSPRGVLEDCLRSLDSETTTSRDSTSDWVVNPDSRNPSHWKGFFRLLKKGPQMRFQTFPPLAVPKIAKRKSKSIREDMLPAVSPVRDSSMQSEFCYFKSSWKNFTLSELEAASNNFNPENLIGEGGYSEVYKGQLEDGQLVAIKRLNRGTQEEMTADFLSELGIIVHVDHPNVASVIGYGVEGGMHLILHLSPLGSLASILYGPKERLDWSTRYKIALGIAEGLLYLHEGCQRRIIHRDIKASNILLREDFEPQISDFGLAKWLPDQWTHHTVSKFEGTFGYLPPEFFMHGIVDEKTDVYAYGVLLLELITGRQALNSSQQSLVMWAKPLLPKDNLKDLVDPCLLDVFDTEQMKLMTSVASMCINQSSIQRPEMGEIVEILKGNGAALELLQRQKSRFQRTYSEELLDAEEYNSTKYLSDMDRHLEIVLGACDIDV